MEQSISHARPQGRPHSVGGDAPRPAPPGRVLWITGLSGAGKTTLARALQQALPGSLLLDGDELRAALGADGHGFDLESRRRLAMSYARLAALLARQGVTVLVATISLFHELHAWNRANLPGYLEVFLDVPEAVRRSRDPKGLYAANTGNMAGKGVRAELPLSPHLRLDGSQSLTEAVRLVLAALDSPGP